MRVRLHPGARQDLRETAAFYALESSPALALRFIAEFERISCLLMESPDSGSPREGGRRSFPMTVFPYSIIYRVHADEIVVLVVKHDRRHPAHGRQRR